MYQPSYEEVLANTQTPAYVFDIDVLQKRIAYIRSMLGDKVQLCYAMKANPFVIGGISECIDRYEVCSPGEFKICERAEIPMEKVVLSGVYKETSDTMRIVGQYKDQMTYTAESVNQFLLLAQAAQEHQVKIRVLLRITTGNQFGMDEEDLCHLVEHRNEYPWIDIIGIQHFSGTQRKRLSKYEEELHYADQLLTKLKETYHYEAKELEFGPGFYVEYFQDGKPYDEEEVLLGFKALLEGLTFQGEITLELGRFIAAPCGNYYTSVVDHKKNSGIEFCIMDGGMHQVNYFGQMMAMKLPYYRQLSANTAPKEEVKCNVCGSLCTVNDNLVKSLPLHSPVVGDILEFQRVGAYSMSEGVSLFLSRDLPKVYLYTKDDGFVMMRDKFETNVLNYKGK